MPCQKMLPCVWTHVNINYGSKALDLCEPQYEETYFAMELYSFFVIVFYYFIDAIYFLEAIQFRGHIRST